MRQPRNGHAGRIHTRTLACAEIAAFAAPEARHLHQAAIDGDGRVDLADFDGKARSLDDGREKGSLDSRMRLQPLFNLEADFADLLDDFGLSVLICTPGEDRSQRIRLEGDALRSPHELKASAWPG